MAVARTPPITWRWSHAWLGALYAVPAALVIPADVDAGIALAVGVLPAALAGLPPTRHARRSIALMGAVVGVPMALGALVADIPVLAVLVLPVLAVGAVRLTGRVPRLGMLAMHLGLPMVAIGFSFRDDPAAAFTAAGLMVAGSLYGFVVSLLWPEHPPAAAVAAPAAAPPTLDYGIRLGLAGATAAAIGFALDLAHVGWPCGAALLVMRPLEDVQRLRSAGRLVSVALGAATAVAWVHLAPVAAGYSLAIVAVLAAAAATQGSRWYITSAFTTFLVFTLLLHGAPQDGQDRFNERLVETALGVAIAYVYGLPIARLRTSRWG